MGMSPGVKKQNDLNQVVRVNFEWEKKTWTSFLSFHLLIEHWTTKEKNEVVVEDVISPTIYKQLLRQFSFTKKLQT